MIISPSFPQSSIQRMVCNFRAGKVGAGEVSMIERVDCVLLIIGQEV